VRIVVLDGHTLNPGDLTWEALAALGELTVHPRTPPEEVVARCRGAAAVLTNKTKLDARTLAALPELTYIGVLATGVNVVDLPAAAEHGVTVTNVPAYSTPSVAQATLALLLELCHHAGDHSREVRDGAWSRSPDFCFWRLPVRELAGLTLGVVGFGHIGRRVAELGHAFGMAVLAHTRTRGDPPDWQPFAFVDRERLLAEADVVSLHCPLTPETEGLIDAAALRRMKREAFLLNTARGGLVDDDALAAALAKGELAGAGLDVIGPPEPPAADNPLLAAPNCVITPHIGWASRASRRRLLATVVENLRAFAAGRPQNVVAPPA
jgi:glycerate dehydrogenase